MLDDGTSEFLNQFDTVDKLVSPDAEATLTCLAWVWLMDINIVERNHSEMQNELRAHLIRPGAFGNVSCKQFMRRVKADLKTFYSFTMSRGWGRRWGSRRFPITSSRDVGTVATLRAASLSARSSPPSLRSRGRRGLAPAEEGSESLGFSRLPTRPRRT